MRNLTEWEGIEDEAVLNIPVALLFFLRYALGHWACTHDLLMFAFQSSLEVYRVHGGLSKLGFRG